MLQVSHDLGVGGLPRVVETLVRTIDPERFEVSALTLNFRGELADALEADGYHVTQLPSPPRRPDRLSFARAAKVMREGRYDVVHSHNTQPFFDAALGSMLAPRRVLIHTDHARDFPDKLRYMVAEHLFSWRAFRVVGVSQHTTDNLHRYERIPRWKLRTIPNGIDGRLFDRPIDRDALRRDMGAPPGATIALFASRLEDQKDVPTLLDAFARLAARLPTLHLAIAGQGSRAAELQARVDALGLAARIRFLGVRLDVPDLLRAADCFVLSSTWEGLPMVILEALGAGCPILATAVGGVPTAVRDGETGLLVAPRDPGAFAGALERLVGDAALRARLASAGQRLFAERFSAHAMARAYEALYLDGCRRRGIT